mgnify:CR=1 FL=1
MAKVRPCRVMDALGKLLSTRETRVAPGSRLLLSNLPRISIARRKQANREPIVNYVIILFYGNGAEQVVRVMQLGGCEQK